MKLSLLICATVVIAACNQGPGEGGAASREAGSTAAPATTSNQSDPAATQPPSKSLASPTDAAAQPYQPVTVVGCLR